jgi:hypothetical protein
VPVEVDQVDHGARVLQVVGGVHEYGVVQGGLGLTEV